ncbi:MAG: hypothetical protein V3T92_07785 [Anaerolineae bacterium]
MNSAPAGSLRRDFGEPFDPSAELRAGCAQDRLSRAAQDKRHIPPPSHRIVRLSSRQSPTIRWE